jgi:recombination protein RecT
MSTPNAPATQKATIKTILSKEDVQKNIRELVGSPRAAKNFSSALINAVKNNARLANCDPASVLYAAVASATLDLDINENLGYAYLVPYKDKCQFQLGYKGLVQLAQRSGLYKRINTTTVKEGEILSYDRVSGDMEFDWLQDDKRVKAKTVGYMAYFQLLNGFEARYYMTKAEAEGHGKKYSKSFTSGPWKTDFDKMALKTVLKSLLSRFGPMSTEMNTAMRVDQSIVNDFDTEDITYIDGTSQSSGRSVAETELETQKKQIENHCAKATQADELDLLLVDLENRKSPLADIVRNRQTELSK